MNSATLRRPVAARIAILLSVALIAGCVADTGPDAGACAAPAVVLDLELTADGLNPASPSVCRDQAVTLNVESDVDGVLHIHGYDELVPATPVTAGELTELEFVAARSGQFPIELHPEEDPAGVNVGVFTVHEP